MTTEHIKGKGGKKGGTQFPRYSLDHLVIFLKNLASKTHINTVTIQQLNAGVFNVAAGSNRGKIKSSALKQFGLLEGDYQKLKATQLCRDISIAEPGEKEHLLEHAFFNVAIFSNAMKTFHNSTYEKSKIAQYAVSTLKIHPDMKEEFVKIFVDSAEVAGLCTVDGNTVSFLDKVPDDSTHNHEDENADGNDLHSADNSEVEDELDEERNFEDEKQNNNSQHSKQNNKSKNSNINVNIGIDPAMDPEKLEKLLKLLKSYGAI